MAAQNNCSLMQIEIVQGKMLRNDEFLSKSDPYCVIQFDSEVDAQPDKQKTETINNDLNPVWNEKFWCLITDDVTYFDVKVYNKNVLRDSSLGYCRVLRPHPTERSLRNGGWFVLEHGKGGKLEVYCSEITLADITTVMAEKRHQLSSCARNYSDRFALLDLRILSAKDLKAADFNGKSDPYAVVTWDKSAKAFPRKLRTATVKKTLNPRWNTVFHVLVDPSTATSFRVDIYDEDFAIDDSIGHVNVPLNDINLGDQQEYAVVKGKGTVTIAHCLVPISGLF